MQCLKEAEATGDVMEAYGSFNEKIKLMRKQNLRHKIRDEHKFVLDIVRSAPWKYLKLDKGHTKSHYYRKNRDWIKASMNLNQQEHFKHQMLIF